LCDDVAMRGAAICAILLGCAPGGDLALALPPLGGAHSLLISQSTPRGLTLTALEVVDGQAGPISSGPLARSDTIVFEALVYDQTLELLGLRAGPVESDPTRAGRNIPQPDLIYRATVGPQNPDPKYQPETQLSPALADLPPRRTAQHLRLFHFHAASDRRR
jgi:hypothetical protein